MAPPVALLTYVPDEPARAAFYPFARFSPEWRAIRHALDRDVPVRFMDLPAANKMAGRDDDEPRARPARRPARPRSPRSPATATPSAGGRTSSSRAARARRVRGGDRGDGRAARGVPRRTTPARSGARRTCASRSARRASRARERRGRLRRLARARARRRSAPPRPTSARCKGLPKVKVAATWVPWTYGLLARARGYGAGVDSPAWYDQLFDEAEDPVARWLSRAAQLLRAEGLDASAAQVVDAARLAMALAGIRDRPLAGLDELLDATRAVLCHGCDVPLALVRAELVVGHRLGEVPEDTPMVPLQQDVSRLQRRLRLKPEAQVQGAHARPAPRERPRALAAAAPPEPARRAVGRRRSASRGQGTFKEAFRLEWYPELALELIHAGRWGTTVHAAADGAGQGARRRGGERRRAGHARRRRPARRPARTRSRPSCSALADRAALDRDTADLMAAVPPLAGHPALRRRARERHARGRAGAARHRPARRDRPAGRGRRRRRGDRRAARRARSTASTPRSRCSRTPSSPAPGARRCARVAERRAAPGHARRPRHPPPARRGRARARRKPMSRALSPGEDPERGASWIEGFIGTSGLVLVHDPELLARPRRLGRDRPAGRLHQRPPAAAPRLLRPPRGRAPPPRRTPPRT